MSIKPAIFALIPLLAVAQPATAQAPISAIQWLDKVDSLAALAPPDRRPMGPGSALLVEPPVADGAKVPDVVVTSLDQLGDGPLGLMPKGITGLPVELWRGSDPKKVSRMLARLDLEDLPAMQALLYSLLLTETLPPLAEEGKPEMLLARVDALTELGSVDPAMALIEHAGAELHPDLFRRYFDLALLSGNEGDACARLAARPDLAPDYAVRVYCLARTGDWQAAMVTFGSMVALGEFTPRVETLLQLFLEPELIEGMPPLAPSADVTPLVFRLEEAIGQPLSTAALPRVYATSDLRNVSGWKAELEAVERLARTGALSEKRLFEVYGERRPAASGGIWDRVEALQRFDTAMNSRDPGAVARTLPAAWAAMQQSHLEVPFARFYAPHLAPLPLTGEAHELAFAIAMLSPEYESLAARMTPQSSEERFLAALAKGVPQDAPTNDPLARAISRAFSDPTVPPTLEPLLSEGRLGEAILRAMTLFASGMEGNFDNLEEGLAGFRAMGLEDTARRAGLQLMLLNQG